MNNAKQQENIEEEKKDKVLAEIVLTVSESNLYLKGNFTNTFVHQ